MLSYPGLFHSVLYRVRRTSLRGNVYVILCSIILCYIMLYCVVLYYIMSCYAMSYYACEGDGRACEVRACEGEVREVKESQETQLEHDELSFLACL